MQAVRAAQALVIECHPIRAVCLATLSSIPLSGIRAELLARWLILSRRLFRLPAHASAAAPKARSRLAAARRGGCAADVLFGLLGYRLWWCIRSPFAAPCDDSRCLVVIGGASRSGTTLLRSILGRHPLIASGPETTVLLRRVSSPDDLGKRLGWQPAAILRWQRESRSQAEFIRRFQRAVLARSGKAIWAEKTPRNVGRFGFVRRRLRRAKLVHVIRDGRDTVCSLRRKPFARLDRAPWDSAAAARRCAVQWRTSVKAGLRFRGDPAYHELRYEDLVRDPEPTLRALVDFLGVPWTDRLLDAAPADGGDPDEMAASGDIFRSSLGRWRRDLSAADRAALRPLIGPLLVKLGYERDLSWQPVTVAPAPERASRRVGGTAA